MNILNLYIGENSDIVAHYKKVLDDNIEVFDNYMSATDFINAYEKSHQKVNELLFFEKNSPNLDLKRIEFLRQNFPGAYIVLVCYTLDENERAGYLAAGVNDTISPEVSMEVIKWAQSFVATNASAILSQKYNSKTIRNVAIFHLPL